MSTSGSHARVASPCISRHVRVEVADLRRSNAHDVRRSNAHDVRGRGRKASVVAARQGRFGLRAHSCPPVDRDGWSVGFRVES